MANSISQSREELIKWISDLDDKLIIQKMLNLKSENLKSSEITKANDEKIQKNDFDQQFAAGMTSEELLENVFTHIETISKK